MHEAIHTVSFDKRRAFAVAMLLKPRLNGIRYADIQRAMASAGEDVDIIHAGNADLARLSGPVVIDPCFRRDDSGYVDASVPFHTSSATTM